MGNGMPAFSSVERFRFSCPSACWYGDIWLLTLKTISHLLWWDLVKFCLNTFFLKFVLDSWKTIFFFCFLEETHTLDSVRGCLGERAASEVRESSELSAFQILNATHPCNRAAVPEKIRGGLRRRWSWNPHLVIQPLFNIDATPSAANLWMVKEWFSVTKIVSKLGFSLFVCLTE